MSKYKILKESIAEWIEQEKENLADHGSNNCMGSMSIGAIEAYEQVLNNIVQLEKAEAIDD